MRAAEWSESGRGLNLVIGRNFCETPRYAAVTSVVLNTLHQSHSHWQFIVADSDSPVPLISETTSLLLERDTMRLVRRHFVRGHAGVQRRIYYRNGVPKYFTGEYWLNLLRVFAL